MKPQAFDYARPDSAEETVAMLAQAGDDARILAGGQSLMAVLNLRLAQPSVLIDISRVPDLNYVRVDGKHLAIGAAATQGSVEWRPGLKNEVPLLAQAFPHISHFQIRNRGTVCGSVAHADPSAELPLALLALEGEVVLRSGRGRRVVAAADFFQGMLMTARAQDELVEEVRYPLAQAGVRYAFDEFSGRHGDFAVCAVAAVVKPDGIRLAVGGVSDRPVVRAWPRLDGADLDAAINDFAWELGAKDDHHASAKFRRQLVRHLGRAAIDKAQ
ncbi:FAD binding domain-containing protein [Massilia sp. YIM B02769]|uniref:FAD binding domain-containing protein n=1 Tax=unclassified Massilia TaxID=2609279 RepID=UPI0025B716AB|nr:MULTISPECIES: FAD binding domain-containing protein [unclassified Massilia]MDN4058224.1 FAD binding domain-containing protein [Massilia sp. YIM B02769]